MTSTLTQTPLEAAGAAAAETHATWSRWHHQEQTARADAARAREELASVELRDPDAAFALMQRIEDADRRATAAQALAEAAKDRHTTARAERTRQQGLELQAAAEQAWSTWENHHARTVSLLAQLAQHEGISHEPPRLHDATRGELMLHAARAADGEAAALVVGAGGCYMVARPGPVLDGGERDVHIGFSAPANDTTLRPVVDPVTRQTRQVEVHRDHYFDVTVDGRPWGAGSLQTSLVTEGMNWTMRPLPATATIVVTSRTTRESFTLPPAETGPVGA